MLPDICWKCNTAERKLSRRFLECVEDNFLTQLVSEPSRTRASLDLLFTKREGLVGDVMVRGHLGLSNHEMTEFLVRGEVGGQQNHHHGLSESRLWPVQDAGSEGTLGESGEGQRGPGRHSSRRKS